MVIEKFPNIDLADENGLLALGGDLDIQTLLNAYSSGIFPWPISMEHPLAWFSPDPRGIILFEDLHIPKSLQKIIDKKNYEVTINQHFPEVIYNCANVTRKYQDETWINAHVMSAYINLFKAGYAYSLEIHEEESLIGGIYGVVINGYVSGESMYFLKNNASKIALVELIFYLRSQGVEWLDTQMVTSVVSSLGGKNTSRESFIKKLDESLKKDVRIF